MPSISTAGALLTLSSTHMPWVFETWKNHTKVETSPFSASALTNPPDGWTVDLVKALQAFAANFWAKPNNDKIDYIQRRKDNDAAGRDAWNDWVSKGWGGKWKIRKIIDHILVDRKLHPYAVMHRLQTNEVSLQLL